MLATSLRVCVCTLNFNYNEFIENTFTLLHTITVYCSIIQNDCVLIVLYAIIYNCVVNLCVCMLEQFCVSIVPILRIQNILSKMNEQTYHWIEGKRIIYKFISNIYTHAHRQINGNLKCDCKHFVILMSFLVGFGSEVTTSTFTTTATTRAKKIGYGMNAINEHIACISFYRCDQLCVSNNIRAV